MEEYILVFGGCGWDSTYKQREDFEYLSIPDIELPGGKGANQAVACARAGYPVKMISIVGDDEVGRKTISNLKENGIDVSAVKVLKGIKSDRADIFVSLNGDNDIKRYKEAIEKFDTNLIEENAELIKNAKLVITQSKMPKDVYVALINFCHQHGVKTILTPSQTNGLKINDLGNAELLKKVTYITANETETKEITQTGSIEEALKVLPNLISTAGANGVYFIEKGKVKHVPAMKPSVIVDTTGAGDTFCGNFAVALLDGYSKLEAVQMGIKASTLKLEKMGAQPGMPYKEELVLE